MNIYDGQVIKIYLFVYEITRRNGACHYLFCFNFNISKALQIPDEVVHFFDGFHFNFLVMLAQHGCVFFNPLSDGFLERAIFLPRHIPFLHTPKRNRNKQR